MTTLLTLLIITFLEFLIVFVHWWIIEGFWFSLECTIEIFTELDFSLIIGISILKLIQFIGILIVVNHLI